MVTEQQDNDNRHHERGASAQPAENLSGRWRRDEEEKGREERRIK